MTEDIRGKDAGTDEDLLHVDPVETSAKEDLSVTGKHKSHKKKRSKGIYTLLIVLLLCVMGYSGYQIVSTLLRNRQANNTYSDIASQFVVEIPSGEETEQGNASKNDPAQPSSLPAGETVPSGEGQTETESGDVIIPVDPGVSTGEDVPQTTAAPAPSMGLLSVDFARLKGINSDVCAWLQGQGGTMSYPVVQGSDNVYYLKHLIDGSYNGNGTLFVHCENRFLEDDVTYIFGHHMYGGAMFGNLKKYDSTQYYWQNQEFRLYTPEKVYTLRIYAVFYGTGTEQIAFNYADEADFNTAMKTYASRTLHPATVPVSYGDKLVCLCTCAYHVDNGRYFVYCKVMNP